MGRSQFAFGRLSLPDGRAAIRADEEALVGEVIRRAGEGTRHGEKLGSGDLPSAIPLTSTERMRHPTRRDIGRGTDYGLILVCNHSPLDDFWTRDGGHWSVYNIQAPIDSTREISYI